MEVVSRGTAGRAGLASKVRARRGRSLRVRAGKGFGKKKIEPLPRVEETNSASTSTSSFGVDAGRSLEERVVPPEEPSVPDEVVDRALTRMLTFSGIPFAAGLLFFPSFWYLKVVRHVDVPMYVVYAVSTVFVGVSLAGITYGLLSTSGTSSQKSFLGFEDFKRNLDSLIGKK